jgi:hypothetical protein
MQSDHFVNLTNQDWTNHNQQVLKYCKELADKAVLEHTADYPATRHLPVVKGVLRWDRMDYFLEMAAKNHLFDGIEACWTDFQGAPILELRGKFTSLTACHVLSRDDKPPESAKGYRKNNRARNQKNQELFKEFETHASEDEKLHLILRHGGREDNFAYLQIYLEDSDIPALSGNIMLLPSLDMTPETEFVLQPIVTLTAQPAVPASDNSSDLPPEKSEHEHSHS